MRVTRGVIAQRYTYAPPRCRTSQYRRTFIPCQYHCGKILVIQYSMVWNWRGSRAGPMPFYWPSCHSSDKAQTRLEATLKGRVLSSPVKALLPGHLHSSITCWLQRSTGKTLHALVFSINVQLLSVQLLTSNCYELRELA